MLVKRAYYRLVPYRESALDYALKFNCEDVGIDFRCFAFLKVYLYQELIKEIRKTSRVEDIGLNTIWAEDVCFDFDK
jgi:hypothetical protein